MSDRKHSSFIGTVARTVAVGFVVGVGVGIVSHVASKTQ